MPRITRRRLLQSLLAAALGALALVLFWRPRALQQLLARYLEPRLDPSSPAGTLSEAEMANVLALAEVVAESRILSEAEKADLAEHVNDRTRETPGYLALYRSTAGLLDRLGPKPFTALPLPDRIGVTLRNRLVPSDATTLDYLLPRRRRAFAARKWVVPDLIGAHYRSPAGWGVVGYAAFPGRCGDLTRYTRPEALGSSQFRVPGSRFGQDAVSRAETGNRELGTGNTGQ